jgi:O-acetyl-ADP-ribose deacetylase (regulator of RNase III)
MPTKQTSRDRELAALLKEVRALRRDVNAIKRIPAVSQALGGGKPDYEVAVKAGPQVTSEYEVLVKTGPKYPAEYEVAVKPAVELPPDYAVLARTFHIDLEGRPEVERGEESS